MKENEQIMEEPDILDLNDEVLVQAYEGNNYECIDTGVDSNICYIMFSSNGLYYPNTREVFEEEILKKNRYEWKWVIKKSCVPKTAGRIIYVRDIYKEWYTKGINERENTIDKTLDLLKELTRGYKVITVGSSAGGYMAVLAAVKLNAEYCFNFSGQYMISDDLKNPYTNLTGLLKGYDGDVFYFLPIHCENDKREYESVKNIKCVKVFSFNEDKHAATMLTGNMCYIVGKTREEMLILHKRYSGKLLNKFVFLLQTVQLHKVFGIMKKEVQGFVVRRSGKHWMGV